MQRARRRNPRLQEKLESLQREIARVEKDIKGISHAIESPDPDQAIRRLRKVVGEIPSAEESQWLVPQESTRNVRAERNTGSAPDAPDVVIPRPVPDQRFQTYFGTGSLHSVRPLRQERRIQRNKAIVMSILALAFLYSVFKLIL
jgi:hypothetical protein